MDSALDGLLDNDPSLARELEEDREREVTECTAQCERHLAAVRGELEKCRAIDDCDELVACVGRLKLDER